MNVDPDPISIAILAGGANKRFGGEPKAFLPWKGAPLIHHYLNLLNSITDDLMIISNHRENYTNTGIPVYSDLIPGKGPLSGIHTALCNAQHPWVLVVACDMPFLPVDLIRHLKAFCATNAGKVIMPVHEHGLEPMFAIWPSEVKHALGDWLLCRVRFKIMDFIHELNLFEPFAIQPEMIEPHHFMNINTPEDLAQAIDIARKSETRV